MKRYQQSMSFYAPKEYTHTTLRPSVMRYQCRFKCMEKNIYASELIGMQEVVFAYLPSDTQLATAF